MCTELLLKILTSLYYLLSSYKKSLFCLCRILWKKNSVAEMEATTYSIFYNNTLFLFLMLIMSFYALRSFNPGMYPFLQTSVVYACMYKYINALHVAFQFDLLTFNWQVESFGVREKVKYFQQLDNPLRSKSWAHGLV